MNTMLFDASSPALSPAPSLPSTPTSTPYSSPPSPFATSSAGSVASSIHSSARRVLLPGAAFASEALLSKLSANLEQGGGDLVILAVNGKTDAVENNAGASFEHALLACAQAVASDGLSWDDEWEKVAIEADGECL